MSGEHCTPPFRLHWIAQTPWILENYKGNFNTERYCSGLNDNELKSTLQILFVKKGTITISVKKWCAVSST